MKRRPSGSLLLSVALHIVFGAVLVYVLSVPFPLQEWLERRPPPPPAEQIQYVTVPSRLPSTPGRSGGNGKPVTRKPPVAMPRLVAPATVPTRLPPAPPVRAVPERGSGPVVGEGGVTRGVVPSFSDPRVWLPPGEEPSVPKGLSQSLDSVLASRIQAYNDSMAVIAGNAGRKPGDWTVERHGKKYGIDQKHIYLGSFKIPAAILALLPLNVQGNPTEIQRNRALNAMHDEIVEQAQRAMNEEEFRDAVKKIRERKQREHDAALLAKKKQKEAAQRADDPAVPHP